MLRKHTRRIAGALAMALTAGYLAATAGPAFAFITDDGPPTVDQSPAPMSGPTAGGMPLRIYGSGFHGTTAVKFGTVNATSFYVVDSHLITAVLPAASGGSGATNTSVDITVTDPDGTGTGTNTGDTTGFYYTNATISANPATGINASTAVIIVSVANYLASTPVVLPEFNPLLVYLEQATVDFPAGPPPYASVRRSPTTDSSGNLTTPSTGNQKVQLQEPFDGTSGSSYDSRIDCPVDSTTVNYLGVSTPSGSTQAYSGKCMLAIGNFGKGSIETPIGISNPAADPTPTAPVLNLSPTSSSRGSTVNVGTSSNNWNANPFFGSSTAHSNPGETAVEVKICWSGGSNCSTTLGSGTVSMTRYIDKVFSGATLTGSIVVGNDVPSPCLSSNCYVQVKQYGPGGTQNIVKTTGLAVS